MISLSTTGERTGLLQGDNNRHLKYGKQWSAKTWEIIIQGESVAWHAHTHVSEATHKPGKRTQQVHIVFMSYTLEQTTIKCKWMVFPLIMKWIHGKEVIFSVSHVLANYIWKWHLLKLLWLTFECGRMWIFVYIKIINVAVGLIYFTKCHLFI